MAGDGPVAAAVAVARAHGLTVTEPEVLRDRYNVLVHLRPAPVVARVPATIAKVRPGEAWLRREVEVAGALARAGAPVVGPSPELPLGPHRRDGHAITFWAYVPPAEVDPRAAGAALGECHAALRDVGVELPHLGGLPEAEAMLAGEPALRERLARARADAEAIGPLQPLHGDAHLGNVLGGARWNDWEDACLGPPGWDAACLLVTARVTGTGGDRAHAALAAAAIPVSPDELERLLEARLLQVSAWAIFVSREHPERRAALEPWLRAARALC